MLVSYMPWWRQQMVTFSVLLALCDGNRLTTASQGPVTRSFDVFFDLCLNKQSKRRWHETPLHSLQRHCNTQWKPRSPDAIYIHIYTYIYMALALKKYMWQLNTGPLWISDFEILFFIREIKNKNGSLQFDWSVIDIVILMHFIKYIQKTESPDIL